MNSMFKRGADQERALVRKFIADTTGDFRAKLEDAHDKMARGFAQDPYAMGVFAGAIAAHETLLKILDAREKALDARGKAQEKAS